MRNSNNTLKFRVYDFLKERSLENKWTTQKEIQEYLINAGYVKNIGLRSVRQLVSDIRHDKTIQKIIISSWGKVCGYKILSDKEELKYLEIKKKELLTSLKQYWDDVARYNANNQTKIVFGEYERNFYESVLSSDKKDEK